MSTFSISLPSQIASKIDAETKKQGYSTRSEFIRDLLRRYFSQQPPFEIFTSQSLEKVRADLVKVGKYDQKSIDSIIKGLSMSSVYASQTD